MPDGRVVEVYESISLEFKGRFARPDISRSADFRGLKLEYNRVTSTTEYEFKNVGQNHYLALHDLVMDSGELEVEDLPTIPGKDLRNKMTYVPAGRPLSGWTKTTGRQNSFTILHFDPALLSQETEHIFAAGESVPLIYFEDPLVFSTMKKLEATIADGLNQSSVYIETLALLAALEIGNLQAGCQKANEGTGRLSKPQITQLQDYIEANLAMDIRLDDLARLVQLSRFHLARRFKTSFGAPPHQYITARRVEFARHLLRDSTLSVNDVAQASGFASAGPFIKAFRQSLGTTPSVYRRG